MNDFMLSQKKRIEQEKWFEGHRTNKDPGSGFVLKWIKLNAANFRKSWNKSLCKTCELCPNCGYKVMSDCADFKVKNNDKGEN